MAASESAAALIGVLNKVIKYAVAAGVGASVLQTSLFTGARPRAARSGGARAARRTPCRAAAGGAPGRAAPAPAAP
jgi:hypothetical protein